VDSRLPQPDHTRLSTLTALVLLCYGLIRIVVLPPAEVDFTLLGLLIRVEINAQLVMLSLAAVLAAAGSDWLVRSHPVIARRDSASLEHMIIPGLAALGIGAIVVRIPYGPVLWIGLLLAAAILLAVASLEFIVLDADDRRYAPASILLTGLAYLLLAGAIFAIRSSGTRAIFALPLIFLATAGVIWRLLRLERMQTGAWPYALILGWISAQLAWGLHYMLLAPLQEGLGLALTTYLTTSVTSARLEGGLTRRRATELVAVGMVGMVLILLA
jgi:hypothetical protein